MTANLITSHDAYAKDCDNGYLESRMTPQDRLLRDAATEEYIRKMVALLITPWLATEARGRFLELGCGHGAYASFFVDMVEHYTGYDIYLPSLQAAQERLQAHNCTLVHGDGRTLKEVGDASQDFVFSFQSLVHVPDPDIICGYIREACRVLSQRGAARLHILGPNFQQGLHLGWLPLAGLARTPGQGLARRLYQRSVQFLQKRLPPDLMLPKPMGSPPDHPVWKIGATLNPLQAIRFAENQGCKACVLKGGWGSPNEALWSSYWLVIHKGTAPFFTSFSL